MDLWEPSRLLGRSWEVTKVLLRFPERLNETDFLDLRLGVDLYLLAELLVLVLIGEKAMGRLSSWKVKGAEVVLFECARDVFFFLMEHRLFSFCRAAVIFMC